MKNKFNGGFIMEEKKLKPKTTRKSRSKRDLDYADDAYDEHHYYYRDDMRRRRADHRDYDEPREIHHHYYYEPPRKKGRSSKPKIIGSLLLIVGVLGLIFAPLMFFGGWFMGNMGEGIAMFGMEDNVDISGRVTLSNGSPVQNVTISIEGEPLSTQTDADGYYILYNVPTGNQKIRVEKEGYDTIIYKTFINSGTNEDRKSDVDQKNEFDFTIRPGNSIVEQGSYPPFEWIEGLIYACAIIVIILSIIVIIGATFAFKRTHFGFVLIASILGIFTIGFGIGALISIISIFIVILARDEFNRDENNYQENPQRYMN